jgi:tripartite-type tricarboxylate transporter receptor subunit TctC
VCKLVAGTRTFGKAVVLPKQTPAELVDIVKKAAIEMTKDPKFLADSEKDSPGATHFTGEGLARAYPAGVQGPPVVIQFIKKVYAEKYGVTFQ